MRAGPAACPVPLTPVRRPPAPAPARRRRRRAEQVRRASLTSEPDVEADRAAGEPKPSQFETSMKMLKTQMVFAKYRGKKKPVQFRNRTDSQFKDSLSRIKSLISEGAEPEAPVRRRKPGLRATPEGEEQAGGDGEADENIIDMFMSPGEEEEEGGEGQADEVRFESVDPPRVPRTPVPDRAGSRTPHAHSSRTLRLPPARRTRRARAWTTSRRTRSTRAWTTRWTCPSTRTRAGRPSPSSAWCS